MSDFLLNGSHVYLPVPDSSKFYMHTHDFYEIYCFLAGNAKYFIEGNIYNLKHGDILFIKKAEAHCLQITSPTAYERIVINFDAAAVFAGDTLNKLLEFDKMPLGKGNRFPFSVFKGKHWMYYIEKIISSKNDSVKQLYLSVLINELYECRDEALKLRAEQDSFSDIIAYLNTNITEELTLDSICENFYISKSQLNRKFRRMIGSTVWEYVTAKRLIMAKELLQKGEAPMKVYSQCGFNDYTSFYRAYKSKFSVSPKKDCIKL